MNEKSQYTVSLITCKIPASLWSAPPGLIVTEKLVKIDEGKVIERGLPHALLATLLYCDFRGFEQCTARGYVDTPVLVLFHIIPNSTKKKVWFIETYELEVQQFGCQWSSSSTSSIFKLSSNEMWMFLSFRFNMQKWKINCFVLAPAALDQHLLS